MYKKEMISATIDVDLKIKILEHAKIEGRSFSSMVNALLKRAIESSEKQKQEVFDHQAKDYKQT